MRLATSSNAMSVHSHRVMALGTGAGSVSLAPAEVTMAFEYGESGT
jgi:hypothetical protein